jgi:tRNA wybutosine-synthesizing protein 3
MSSSNLPHSFLLKKKRILESLAVPEESYEDLSPKGSVDERIRDLIEEINRSEGFVTTSSCAGRTSVFLEGKRSISEENDAGNEGEESGASTSPENGVKETRAGVGGKGGGGRWLFVSHDRLELDGDNVHLPFFLGITGSTKVEGKREWGKRMIHFKFEPMVSSTRHA